MLEPDRITRAERELKSLTREVGQNDPEAFAQLVAIRDHFDSLIALAANELRNVQGYSWADLARPLGLSRQSVYERYRRDGQALTADN